MGQNSTRSGSSITCLDHDHCESEHVGFLAVRTPHQDFWRSPSWGVAVVA